MNLCKKRVLLGWHCGLVTGTLSACSCAWEPFGDASHACRPIASLTYLVENGWYYSWMRFLCVVVAAMIVSHLWQHKGKSKSFGISEASSFLFDLHGKDLIRRKTKEKTHYN
jgi:hypothetical protein